MSKFDNNKYDDIFLSDENDDEEDICFKCGTKMYEADENELLVCPKCGNSFYADDRDLAYEQWVEEQEEESGFYDNDDFDDLEEPECCRACGGPWPDCESSCSIFDD